MNSYSIIFYAFLVIYTHSALPCPIQCETCSSSTQCLTCNEQYYPAISSGVLTCPQCSQYCLTCTSDTVCTRCMTPYVLNSTDFACYPCEIAYATECSSTVSATNCQEGRYASDNYCYSCLLNCGECSSNSDCKSCLPGYFLNTSVLTCNLCPQHCLTCDQYNSQRCLSCQSGYSLNLTYSCVSVICSISNCEYCSSTNICQKCESGYYWQSTTFQCLAGASIVCENGANGPYPNQCTNYCSEDYFQSTTISISPTTLWCRPNANVRVSSGSNVNTYSQNYYYIYNQLQQFKSLISSPSAISDSLSSETSTGEYSLQIPTSSLSQQESVTYLEVDEGIGSYYRLTIAIKYRTVASSLTLSLSATTESDLQEEQVVLETLSAQNTIPMVQQFTTKFLHSNNVKIIFRSAAQDPIYIVQMLIRAKKCPQDCFRCLNDDLCQMCQEPQYVSAYKCVDNCTIYYHMVSNRSCLTSCPQQYYPSILSPNDKYCEPCQSPCQNCISDTKCLTCIQQDPQRYFFYQYQCLLTCPDSYFKGHTSRQCQPCISPCKLCLDQVTCLSCDEGYWDSQAAQCTNSCPSGTFGQNSTNTCVACESPCVTCRDSSTKCLSCIEGYYFHQNKCLSQCPDRYYSSTVILANLSQYLTCKQCLPPCMECISSTQCVSCSYNYLYEQDCIQQCPQHGYYENQAYRICSTCDEDCLTCDMQGICTVCKSESGCFLEGTCIDECPYGLYYPQYTNVSVDDGNHLQNNVCWCTQCSYPCLQCISGSQCLSCLQGYHYGTNHSCLSLCPIGYFANDTKFTCDPCTSSNATSSAGFGQYCLECDPNGCNRCQSPYILHNGICLSQCPQFHYSSSEVCHKCIAPCLDCISFTECTSCIQPYILNGDVCLIQCPFSYVAVPNNQDQYECVPCTPPCLSCSVSATNCSMCQYGYFLFQNQCFTNCSSISQTPFSYYNQLITSTCSLCMFPCQTCESQTHCRTCQIGYLTLDNKCQACPYGTFANEDTNNSCVQCPTQCSICYSNDYCIACNQNYYLFNHTCISDTSICTENGYYAVGRKCEICSMPCDTCNQTANNCLTCLTGFIYYQPTSKCITDCPKGTYRFYNSTQLITKCQSCDPACRTCTSISTYCFQCVQPYLHVPSAMSCVQSCPDQTFNQGKTCLPCRYPCRLCSSQSACLSCITGTLIANSCLTSCGEGQFSNNQSICEDCSSPCKQCQNTSSSCTQCQEGFYLFEGECLFQCPSLYFAEQEAMQCLECLGLCEECNSHINCTTCPSDLIYYYNEDKDYGQCMSECPVQFYNLSSICTACRSDCLTCEDGTKCILCLNNKPQFQGECLDECPAQMYPDGGICQSCSAPCFNCSDTYTCTSCMDDSFLLVGSAQCIVGDTCPQGFYLIPGTRNCNGECPQSYYHRNDRTCNDSGCDTINNEYNGADMFCYPQCPEGYISDANYDCKKCSSQSSRKCDDGLFFEISSAIKKQQLFVYIKFSEDPIYGTGIEKPNITINPWINHEIHLYKQERRRALMSITSPDNITIQMYPQTSLTRFQMKIQFNQALLTYTNPLQRPSKTFFIQGYNLYPQLPNFNIGLLVLACAMIGLTKYPYMLDFSQLIFILGLIDFHYPNHLASTLQSARLAHLNQFMFGVDQGVQTLGNGKFSYVTNLGILSNCSFNLIILAAGLAIFGILALVYQCLRKSAHYNRVDPNGNNQNIENNEIMSNEKKAQQSENSHTDQGNVSMKIKALLCLRNNFIDKFIPCFFSRLFYFNYMPVTLFTFGQISKGSVGNNGAMAVAIAVLCLIGVTLLYPIIMFKSNKTKYTILATRKSLIALALLLSIENPTYMIGVAAVVALTTSLLVGSYKLEKWWPETKFIIVMEVMQFVLIVVFAIFAMIGQGNSTSTKVKLGWAIIFLTILICILYIGFAIFQLILYSCKKFRNKDYKQQWQKEEQKEFDSKDSEQNTNPDLKENQQKKQQSKSVKIEKLLHNMNKDAGKQQGNHHKQPTINNNQLFWTYNEDDDENGEKDSEGNHQAPEMLIRCVNQFSDFDHNQIKNRNEGEDHDDDEQ